MVKDEIENNCNDKILNQYVKTKNIENKNLLKLNAHLKSSKVYNDKDSYKLRSAVEFKNKNLFKYNTQRDVRKKIFQEKKDSRLSLNRHLEINKGLIRSDLNNVYINQLDKISSLSTNVKRFIQKFLKAKNNGLNLLNQISVNSRVRLSVNFDEPQRGMAQLTDKQTRFLEILEQDFLRSSFGLKFWFKVLG